MPRALQPRVLYRPAAAEFAAAGRSRLAAWVGLSARPGLTIRRHRLADVTFTDLSASARSTPRLAGFPGGGGASPQEYCGDRRVERRQNDPAAGVSRRIRPAGKDRRFGEGSGTGLDRLPERHRRVVALEAREANAEGAGEISLATLMTHALRMNARRILVGEVRGDELIPMLTAMGSGNPGSLCTLHANTSAAATSRMVAIGLTSTHRLPAEATHALIADAVDFVVHLTLVEPDLAAGRRVVASVREVLELGEGGRITSNEIFAPGPDGRARPR